MLTGIARTAPSEHNTFLGLRITRLAPIIFCTRVRDPEVKPIKNLEKGKTKTWEEPFTFILNIVKVSQILGVYIC